MKFTWSLLGFFLFVCFFSFCNVDNIGNHPQVELGKFGYKSQRKAKRVKNLAIFWRPVVGIYCLNITIFRTQIPQNLATFVVFFHKIHLYELPWICFCTKWQIFAPKKKTLVPTCRLLILWFLPHKHEWDLIFKLV